MFIDQLHAWLSYCPLKNLQHTILLLRVKTGKLRDIIILEGIINDLLQKVGIKIYNVYIFFKNWNPFEYLEKLFLSFIFKRF